MVSSLNDPNKPAMRHLLLVPPAASVLSSCWFCDNEPFELFNRFFIICLKLLWIVPKDTD